MLTLVNPIAPSKYLNTTKIHDKEVVATFMNLVKVLQGMHQNLAGAINTLYSPTVYTVATLPAAATAGAGFRAFVSDATATTFASIVAGTGANKVPVYSDGTNWRIG